MNTVRCLNCDYEGKVLIRIDPGCFGIFVIALAYFAGFAVLFLETENVNKLVFASVFWIIFLYFVFRSFRAVCPECSSVL